jgi:hypothetical protein
MMPATRRLSVRMRARRSARSRGPARLGLKAMPPPLLLLLPARPCSEDGVLDVGSLLGTGSSSSPAVCVGGAGVETKEEEVVEEEEEGTDLALPVEDADCLGLRGLRAGLAVSSCAGSGAFSSAAGAAGLASAAGLDGFSAAGCGAFSSVAGLAAFSSAGFGVSVGDSWDVTGGTSGFFSGSGSGVRRMAS